MGKIIAVVSALYACCSENENLGDYLLVIFQVLEAKGSPVAIPQLSESTECGFSFVVQGA